MMPRRALIVAGVAAGLGLGASAARAEITIGALLSLTGPGAGLGIPARNTIELLPKTIGGETVRWVVIDDTSDTSAAVRAAAKLTEEERVDAIIGPSTTPNSVAILEVAGRTGTPFLSLSGSSNMIVPPEGNRRWAFKLLASEAVATGQMVGDMGKRGVKSLAHIGFATALGDGYIAAMNAEAEKAGIKTVAETRYNPNDTSVASQALRVIAAKPDAVFIAASATPATTPIIELRNRGFTGPIYTVQGIAGPDAIRVGGKALDGVLFSGVPLLVAEQLADDVATKKPALAFVSAFEGRYGAGNRNLFGASLWDSFNLVAAAVPEAMKKGKPGTPEFRTALRDAMERVQGFAGAQGVNSLSPTDHSGADPRGQVMIEIRGGAYQLVK